MPTLAEKLGKSRSLLPRMTPARLNHLLVTLRCLEDAGLVTMAGARPVLEAVQAAGEALAAEHEDQYAFFATQAAELAAEMMEDDA